MKHPNKKQSLLLAALTVAALTLGGVCVAAEADTAPAPPTPPPAAAAQPDGPKTPPPGPNAELRAKVEQFMEDSKALRRELFVVDAAFKAQSRANQPNDALIRELAGRLFDLKDQLRSKAKERGLPPPLVKALMDSLNGQGEGHHHHHGAGHHHHGEGHHHHGDGHHHHHGDGGKAAQPDKKGHQHGMGHQHGHGGAGGHHEDCECEGHGHSH